MSEWERTVNNVTMNKTKKKKIKWEQETIAYELQQ